MLSLLFGSALGLVFTGFFIGLGLMLLKGLYNLITTDHTDNMDSYYEYKKEYEARKQDEEDCNFKLRL